MAMATASAAVPSDLFRTCIASSQALSHYFLKEVRRVAHEYIFIPYYFAHADRYFVSFDLAKLPKECFF